MQQELWAAGRAPAGEGFVRQREASELHSESNRKPAEVLSRGVTPSVLFVRFCFLNQGDDSASKGWDSFLENLILKGQQAPGCPEACFQPSVWRVSSDDVIELLAKKDEIVAANRSKMERV